MLDNILIHQSNLDTNTKFVNNAEISTELTIRNRIQMRLLLFEVRLGYNTWKSKILLALTWLEDLMNHSDSFINEIRNKLHETQYSKIATSFSFIFGNSFTYCINILSWKEIFVTKF